MDTSNSSRRPKVLTMFGFLEIFGRRWTLLGPTGTRRQH